MARKKQFLGLDKRKKSHITRSGKYDRCGKMVFFFNFTTIALQPQIYPMVHYHKEV